MASSVMQRLHNVRQLGLAHLVYPGANYSRFAHSVGACHNAANLIAAVERNSKKSFLPKEIQLYRLVGLLHDIGHYPFSHATEEVIKDHYAEELLGDAGGANLLDGSEADSELSVPNTYNHEALGEYIIRNSEELGGIFKSHGFDPKEVADLFAKVQPESLIGIISSDLDCDRLDYLKRTAHFSGAPFGSVDIKFLIDQATLDEDGVFCFRSKAARAADHLLVCRYYDYMQVPFNKTVVALEWSLVSCLKALFARGDADCSGKSMQKMVANLTWNQFDDQYVFGLFRKLLAECGTSEDVLKDHLRAILDRRPAKLLAGWDAIVSNKSPVPAKDQLITKMMLKQVASEFSLDADRLHIWKTPVWFSKADGSIDPEHQSQERIAEAVQILDPGSNKATLLVSRTDTLIHQLSSNHMAGLRLYYLPKDGEMDETTMRGVVKRFAEALGRPVF